MTTSKIVLLPRAKRRSLTFVCIYSAPSFLEVGHPLSIVAAVTLGLGRFSTFCGSHAIINSKENENPQFFSDRGLCLRKFDSTGGVNYNNES